MEIVQSAYEIRAGGTTSRDPGGKCAVTYARGPVVSDICVKHSGSADKAHGASPRNGTGFGDAAALGAAGLGDTGAYTEAILIRIRSRFIHPATTTATANTMTAEIKKYRSSLA